MTSIKTCNLYISHYKAWIHMYFWWHINKQYPYILKATTIHSLCTWADTYIIFNRNTETFISSDMGWSRCRKRKQRNNNLWEVRPDGWTLSYTLHSFDLGAFAYKNWGHPLWSTLSHRGCSRLRQPVIKNDMFCMTKLHVCTLFVLVVIIIEKQV